MSNEMYVYAKRPLKETYKRDLIEPVGLLGLIESVGHSFRSLFIGLFAYTQIPFDIFGVPRCRISQYAVHVKGIKRDLCI